MSEGWTGEHPWAQPSFEDFDSIRDEDAHHLAVPGLRVEIEQADAPQPEPSAVLPFLEARHITREGRRVAAHIDDGLRTQRQDLLHDGRVDPRSGRIEQDEIGSPLGGRDLFETILHRAEVDRRVLRRHPPRKRHGLTRALDGLDGARPPREDAGEVSAPRVEVERVLDMVDGCLLLVDAQEGPMAQTKFVLSKALQKGLRPVVCLNKVDRPGVTESGCAEVESKLFDLFANMGATDDQLDFAVVYASAREGVASLDFAEATRLCAAPKSQRSVAPLLDVLLARVPPPTGSARAAFKMLVSMIEQMEKKNAEANKVTFQRRRVQGWSSDEEDDNDDDLR